MVFFTNSFYSRKGLEAERIFYFKDAKYIIGSTEWDRRIAKILCSSK